MKKEHKRLDKAIDNYLKKHNIEMTGINFIGDKIIITAEQMTK